MIRQRGSGLTELLIAALVVGIGIAGQIQLHALLLKSPSETRLRQAALTIAEQKIADLHNFSRVGTDPDFDFNDIADNQGGSLQNGQLQLPAGEIIRQLTANQRQTFTLSW